MQLTLEKQKKQKMCHLLILGIMTEKSISKRFWRELIIMENIDFGFKKIQVKEL